MRTIGYGVVMAAVAIAACGGDDDPAGGGSASVPLDKVPGMIAAMQCGAIANCASAVIDLYLGGVSCETYFGNRFEDGEWPNIEKAIEEGRAKYDGTKTQACIDAWSAMGCDIFASRAPDICEEALEGTVAAGGDCTLDVECAGPLFCKVDAACPGKCTARLPGGSTCKDDDECENGFTCDDSLGTCATPGKVGTACGGGKPECTLGLFCKVAAGATDGVCSEISDVLALNDGEACSFDGAGWCKSGLSCVLESWTEDGPQATCKPTVGAGEVCGIGLPNQCPDDMHCNADPKGGKWEGTCVALPSAGQPCLDVEGLQRCANYHVCDGVSNTCKAVQRLDGICNADDQCYSDNCANDKCVPSDACTQ